MNCPKCANENTEDSRFCNVCGNALTPSGISPGQRPDTLPPTNARASSSVTLPAAMPPPVLVAGFGLASLWRRFFAFVLDLSLIIAVGAMFVAWAANHWHAYTEAGIHLEGLPGLLSTLVPALFAFAYYWLMEAAFGVTLGKAIADIQVRKKTGAGPGLAGSMIRNLARIIDVLPIFYIVGFFTALFSKMKQRVGDHLAGTVVIRRESALVIAAGTVLWLAAMGAAGWKTYVLYRARAVLAKPVAGAASSGAPSAPTGSATVPVMVSGDIKLQNFTWLQSSDGPPRNAASYKPGDDIFAKYEVAGFSSNPQGGIEVGLNVVCSDPTGLALDKPWEDTVRGQVASPEAPINASFHIHVPPFAPAGIYKLVLKVQDRIKNTTAEFSPAFTVETSTTYAPASKLELREFHYSHAEGGEAISPAQYHPGESVHYAFDLFGMQFRDGRTNVHVAYNVFSPKGDVLLDKPDWENISDTFVYHPANFFVPVKGYITLPADATAGSYTQRFMITDNHANSSITYESKFELK